MQKPLQHHWSAVKRILRYVAGTTQYGLHLTKASSFEIQAYCDTDWASDVDDRRSTSGFAIFLGSNLIAWKSQKQQTVSRSSIEVEYRSLANVVVELAWLKSLFTELHIHLSQPPVVWCDNLSTVLLTANPILHARTKHIELDLYFVKEKVQSHQIAVKHVPTVDQLADGFTKAILTQNFSGFCSKLTIVDTTNAEFAGEC
ncbi:hypothetical protein CsatA_012753 [Cannabis sativa]